MIPDFWCIVKIIGPDTHYRVFATWAGSYYSSEQWRMNSGIVKVTSTDEYFEFHGFSGSVYRCSKSKGAYGSHWYWQHKIEQFKEMGWEVMPEDTDWLELDWIINEKENIS